MIYVSEEEVLKLLNWNDTFKATEVAMENVSKGRASLSARTFTKVLNNETVLITMPGYLEDNKYGGLACKLATGSKNNARLEKPLPTIHANIMLFDEETGILKAVIAGTEITTWRTAAASAVATQHLFVNNSKQSKILAILGCGVQGKIHAEAFKHFFNFEEIRLWDRNVDKSRQAAADLNKRNASNMFTYKESNEECVKNADVIVTATYAPSPIVKFPWVKEGAHINAVGAGPGNHHSELDEELYKNADVFIDHWAGAHKELHGLEALGIKFKGEVGNVILGQLPSLASNKITIFQSLGMAVEDCAMARLIYDSFVKNM